MALVSECDLHGCMVMLTYAPCNTWHQTSLVVQVDGTVDCLNVTFPSEGTGTVQLQGVDPAGNHVAPLVATWTYDVTPPLVTVTTPQDLACRVHPQPSATVDVCPSADAAAFVLHCTDPGRGTSCVAQWSLSKLPDTIPAFDPNSRGFSLNGTGGSGTSATKGGATVSCNATVAGLEFRNATPGSPFSPVAVLQAALGTASGFVVDGRYRLRVRAVDEGGIVSAEQWFEWWVDSAVPVSPTILSSPARVTTSTLQTFQVGGPGETGAWGGEWGVGRGHQWG
jgi:hypothetical protein